MSDYYSDPYQDDFKAWLIGGIVFLIVFIAFFAVGIFLLVQQIKATQYTAIDAVAVDYRVVYESDYSSFSPNRQVPNYYYIVEYEIDGKTYKKTCDTPASKYNPPDDLGKIITVYVNPNNPKDAVFSNSTHILLTTLCIVVPVCGFVGTYFIFRKAHKIKKDD